MENNSEALSNRLMHLSLDSVPFASPSLSEESSFHLEGSSLPLGPSFEHPVESSSLASVRYRPLTGFRVATESESGCVSNCFANGVGSSCWTVAPNESGSGHASAGSLADALPDLPKVAGVRLDWNAVQRLVNRRVVVLQVVSEGRASADLFYALDEDSDSQLHICLYDFEQYHEEAWNLLCGSRSDWLSIKNKQGFTPLMLSVLYGAALEMVRALALLSSLPLADSRGNTALHYAAYMGRLELVDAMLLEPTPEEYQLVDSFLEQTAVFGEPFPLDSFEQVLLRHRNSIGSLLCSRNVTGEIPLYCAVKSGNLEVTRRLLELRSDPRIQEATEGKTALHQAVLSLNPQIVHSLLSYPSPQLAAELINMKTREGVTPLHTARRISCNQPVQKAAQDEIIAMLVGSGGLDICEDDVTDGESQTDCVVTDESD